MKAHEHLSRLSQVDLATLLGEVVSETPLLISYLQSAIKAHEEESFVAEAKFLDGFIHEIVREIRDSQHLDDIDDFSDPAPSVAYGLHES